MGGLAALLGLGLVVLGVVGLLLLVDRVRTLGRRVEALERELARSRPAPAPPAPAAQVAPPTPARAAAAPATAPPTIVEPAAAAPGGLEHIEQLVGGVWLQNLGAVLVLLGVFLLIVWGYGTGRLGPGVLVVAGVALGLAFAWRGDRVARRMPHFGHALIGIGIGIVYLTLDLGYVRLHVLGPVSALVLLALVSLASVGAGLHYRVQLIAALGVIGAFLPQFMASWLGLGGFHMGPWTLLGYIAAVNVLVFALAARAGWSALDLTALVLGALAWISVHHGRDWGWGVQVALAAQYTLLGLAPLPRLVHAEGRVRGIDLAVIAVAPLALLGASAPFLAWAAPERVAVLLFGLAAAHAGAAWWTDARRPERDLWAPLTGAATLFVTAALERALSPAVTPLAWCAEGLLLLALGLRPRAGSLRVGGHLVLFAGGVWAFARIVSADWAPGMAPLVHASGLRGLVGTVAVLLAGAVLARGRGRLAPLERWLPELWGALGNAMLMTWSGIEAGHLASAWVDPGAGAHRMPPPVGTSPAERRESLGTALLVAAWTAQGAWLGWLGANARRGFLRVCGYLVIVLALAWMLVWPAPCEGWYDRLPLVHATALLELAALALAFALAARLAARRERLAANDRNAPEVVSALAAAGLALWGAREAGHLARTLLGIVPGSGVPASADAVAQLGTLAATFTSAAWLVEAVALMVSGWLRGSAFLRWCGLGLLGVTVLKFVAFDLQTVDVFWRFLTAIAVGAAMLALSYAYQRRPRTRDAGD